MQDNLQRLHPDRYLIVTSKEPVPFEISGGVLIDRRDLKNTHEEADVIIVNRVVDLAKNGATSLKVVCDDTDVLVLFIHFYAQEKLKCELIMPGTSSKRAAIDIKATTNTNIDIAQQLLPAHAYQDVTLYLNCMA